ncbi:hypothetical protein IG631_05035 [Alternaria alternata]|nr:hypothetical protein IG631_05035 [Alternaria alternata]
MSKGVDNFGYSDYIVAIFWWLRDLLSCLPREVFCPKLFITFCFPVNIDVIVTGHVPVVYEPVGILLFHRVVLIKVPHFVVFFGSFHLAVFIKLNFFQYYLSHSEICLYMTTLRLVTEKDSV